jgi:probable HAF family extracellular repeat protein
VDETILEGINDKGLITGGWNDANGNQHAFLYDSATSNFTPFTVNGASLVQVWGVNAQGFIAVLTDLGSFVYCPKSKKKCPAGGTMDATLGLPVHVAPGTFLNYQPRALPPPKPAKFPAHWTHRVQF